MIVDLWDSPFRGRVEPPLEDVAVDHRRTGDFPLSALLARPDVDQKSALRLFGGGPLRFKAEQQPPGPFQQLVSCKRPQVSRAEDASPTRIFGLRPPT